jgi:hypothetical protein
MAAKRWPLALGVGAYLAFVIASFPAGTAYRWFAPDTLALVGVQGTLWSGRAAAASVAGLTLQDLRWRMRPWALFVGRVSADLEARLPDGFVNARVSASPARVRLTDVRASTSIAALRGVLPVSGVRGQASASFSELLLAGGWPTSADGELRLAQLEATPFGMSNARLLPLGDYLVRFQPSAAPEGGIAAIFNDTSGPLEVSGTLALDARRAYTLDALVKPRAGANPDLVQGLAFMSAEPDAEGRRRLMLTGSL